MAVKTFSVAEVLTASDTNTYLANAGLVYVSSASFSNQTSVNVTGFTTTYDVFELVVNFGRHTGASALSATTAVVKNSTTTYNTGYFGAGWYVDYAGTSGATGARNNGADMVMPNIYATTGYARLRATIGGMNTTATEFTITGAYYDLYLSANVTFGYQNNNRTASLDTFQLSNSVAMTGSWSLYGYRKGY